MKVLLPFLMLIGIFVPQLKGELQFIPEQSITLENANQVALVYSSEFAGYLLERLLGGVDLPCALGHVSVDASKKQLYIHRRIWTGLQSGKPTGLYTVDMRDNSIICRTRFPNKRNMTGERVYATGSSSISVESQTALFKTGFGGTAAFVLLDLKADNPILIEHHGASDDSHVQEIPHSIVDDRRFLFIREQWAHRPFSPSHLVFVDSSQRKITNECEVIPIDREVKYTAGIGDFALARRETAFRQPDELIVINAAEKNARLSGLRRLDLGWTPESDSTEYHHNWWIVAERNGNRNRTRVYKVPSLEIVAEIQDIAGESFCAATGLLSIIPRDHPRSLLLYQLPSGREIARISLPAFDYAGSWDLVPDSTGTFVGIHGCQSVFLWGVPPRSAQSRPAPAISTEPEETTQELIAQLSGSFGSDQDEIARELGKRRDVTTVPALLKLLKSSEVHERAAAASALGLIGDKSAVVDLIAALRNTGYDQGAAAEALGKLADPRAVEPLIKVAESGSLGGATGAAIALGDLKDPRAIGALIKLLSHPRGRVRCAAADALGRIGDKRAVSALTKSMTDRDCADAQDCRWKEPIAATATHALGRLGAFNSLCRGLKNPNPTVREAAAQELARCDSSECVSALGEATQDDDLFTKASAVEALANSKADTVHQVLLKASQDVNPYIAGFATRRLGVERNKP